jgi:hypothetical protein
VAPSRQPASAEGCEGLDVAEWWELAIPAGSALVGALSGALVQARSTARQLRWQSDEARAQRRETSDRENQTRYFGERRQAYGEFSGAILDIIAAAHDLRVLRKTASSAQDEEKQRRIASERDRAFEQLTIAAQSLRPALVQVQLVGSLDLAQLGERIADDVGPVMQGQGGLEGLQQLLDTFMERARAELYEGLQ